MESSRGIMLALAVAAVVVLSGLPYSAAQEDENDIWTEEGPRVEGPGRGPRPGRVGPEEERDRGPGSRRRRGFELSDEEISRIMESLKESDPEMAKELAELRTKDPGRFQAELRRHGGEEFGKIMRERMEGWRRDRQADFLEWLKKYVPEEAEELAKLKDKDPVLYGKKYDLVRQKYGRIYAWERRSPELATVLVEDLALQERRDELVGKIKAAKNEGEKKELTTQLEEVVANRYDLLIRRKEIAYEWLLRRLDELQKEVKASKDDILEMKDPKSRTTNVAERVKDLLAEERRRFNWE